MEPQPGIRDEKPDFGLLFALGRMIGFLLLMVPALATIAAVVLLPAYAQLAQTRFDRASLKARIDDMQSLVTANERLIAAMPEDPVLTTRLAMSQTSLWPKNESVISDPTKPLRPPSLVRPERHAQPAPPSGRFIDLARKLENPSQRRGLLFLSAFVMLAAMFLFAAPVSYRKQPPADQSDAHTA